MAEHLQLVGRDCVVCGQRIVVARDADVCSTCSTVVHTACRERHACTPQAAEVSARPPARSVRKPILLLAPVLLSATLGPLVSARLRHWRDDNRIKARVAPELGCQPDDVSLRWQGSTVTASGCGDSAEYAIVCRPVDSPTCMLSIQMSSHQTNAIILEQLGRQRRP